MPFYIKNDYLWGCDKAKGLGVVAVNCGTDQEVHERWKLIEDNKCHLSRFACTCLFQHQLPVSGDKNGLLLLVQVPEGIFPVGKFMICFWGEKEEVTEHFPYLPFLKSLQLKIVNMPKQQSLGWHVLNPFNGKNLAKGNKCRFWRHRDMSSCSCVIWVSNLESFTFEVLICRMGWY